MEQRSDLQIRYLPANQAYCLAWSDGQMTSIAGKFLYESKTELLDALGFNSWEEWVEWMKGGD